jgi:uncharacterized protein
MVGENGLTIEGFYEAASSGKLLGLKCELGHVTAPPRSACRVCGSKTLEKIELSGRGSVLSYTEVFVKSREFPVEVPYVLALVQLKEGGNLIGVVEKGSEARVRSGSPANVKFRRFSDKEWPRIFLSLDD